MGNDAPTFQPIATRLDGGAGAMNQAYRDNALSEFEHSIGAGGSIGPTEVRTMTTVSYTHLSMSDLTEATAYYEGLLWDEYDQRAEDEHAYACLLYTSRCV